MLVHLGGLFLALTCLDMGIKQYVESTFRENEERETVIENVVLRKVYNGGFAFGFLKNRPKVIKIASVLAGTGVLAYDVRLFLKKGKWIQKLGMVAVSAGAVSNIYDRLARGKVIDYIGIRSKNQFLARLTANLGDFYILLGAVLLALKRSYPELSEEELKEISEKVKSRKFKL